jgi:hypothetical protein
LADITQQQRIAADPDFRKLSGPEKIAVFDNLDPEFAQASLADKTAVILQLVNRTPMAPKSKGFMEQASEFGKTLAGDVAGAVGSALRATPPGMMIDALRGKQTVGEDIGRSQLEQLRKGKQEFGQGNYGQAAARTAAGLIPMAGPLAAQTGEEIGEGEYGRAAAHGLELASPYAKDVVKPLARGVSGAARGGASALKGGVETASNVAALPVVRNIPFVRNLRGMLDDLTGRNPRMSQGELAQGLYKEVHGRAPKTAAEKIQAVRMYRDAVSPPKPSKPATPRPQRLAAAHEMTMGELAAGKYQEVYGRLPKTASEKIEAVKMYRKAVRLKRERAVAVEAQPQQPQPTQQSASATPAPAPAPEPATATSAPEPAGAAGAATGDPAAPPHARSLVLQSRGAAKRNYMAARFEDAGLTPEQVERMSDADLETHILDEGKALQARGAIKSSFKKYDPNNAANTPYNIMKLEIAKAMRVRAAAKAAGATGQ